MPGSGGLTVTEDRDAGYTFRIRGRRNHFTISDGEAVELARRAQQRLAGFDGLHMTPLRWLHVTTLLGGPAADFCPDKLRQMTQTAAGLLPDTPAAAVTLG